MTTPGRLATDVTIAQIAMNTSDVAGSLRLYHEAFGFENAGGNALWGEVMAIQSLPADSRGVVWWMVGGAHFFQLEFFQHSRPRQSPLPADWNPSDHGWVRIGICVNEFDRAARALDAWKLPVRVHPSRSSRDRRLVFRDPFVGAMVEVFERAGPMCPTVIYATSSVADISKARRFYAETLGRSLEPLECLHATSDEALWDLPGAKRDGFVASFGGVHIEVVCYSSPTGRTWPNRKITDQGIVNIALGSRDLGLIRSLLNRIRAEGHTLTRVFEDTASIGTYVVDPGCEVELLALPEEYDKFLGFVRAEPFLGEFASKV